MSPYNGEMGWDNGIDREFVAPPEQTEQKTPETMETHHPLLELEFIGTREEANEWIKTVQQDTNTKATSVVEKEVKQMIKGAEVVTSIAVSAIFEKSEKTINHSFKNWGFRADEYNSELYPEKTAS